MSSASCCVVPRRALDQRGLDDERLAATAEQESEETPTTLSVESQDSDDDDEYSDAIESDGEYTELVVEVDAGAAGTAETSEQEPPCRQGPVAPPPSQLQAGPPPSPPPSHGSAGSSAPPPQQGNSSKAVGSAFTDGPDHFSREETMFIFDWDDTVLPSSWVQGQGLRLDHASVLTGEQRAQLAEVSRAAAGTLQAAKRHGTVVLVTNAERGWIELSCQKFLPALGPLLEDVRIVSARTSYEGPRCASPLDWKLHAFDAEISQHYSVAVMGDECRRKNVFSLGDSVHEREALLRATAPAPNCRSKSLKFVERPEISQLCKQHELITGSFGQMVHHDGNLDLCIRCP